jgi:hypothetical protein
MKQVMTNTLDSIINNILYFQKVKDYLWILNHFFSQQVVVKLWNGCEHGAQFFLEWNEVLKRELLLYVGKP